MVFCFSIFWGFVGFTNNITKFFFSVGEASFKRLEFSSIVFDVVYMEGV